MDVFRLPAVVPGGKPILSRRRHPPAYGVRGTTYNAGNSRAAVSRTDGSVGRRVKETDTDTGVRRTSYPVRSTSARGTPHSARDPLTLVAEKKKPRYT